MTYEIKDMNDWHNVNADLVITDPPFGINFGKQTKNYARDEELVADGYVEWTPEEYKSKFNILLDVIYRNTKQHGQALIFSGWQSSRIIHDLLYKNLLHKRSNLTLQGKLYWNCNFAPPGKERPGHNVYEIFWITKGSKWVYNNRCYTSHCQYGEANLSVLRFIKEYSKGKLKYPTKLPYNLLKCLLQHFSNKGDLIFDPLAGSGNLGIVCEMLKRNFVLGDINPNAKKVYEETRKDFRLQDVEFE